MITNLKSEIFNENKSLWKNEIGIKDKKIVYYGASLKNLIFRVGSQEKQYSGDCLKMEDLDSLQI